MSFPNCSKRLLSLVIGAVLIATMAGPVASGEEAGMRVAALALPTGSRADWQQWDSFFTNVVKKLNGRLSTRTARSVSQRFFLTRAINSFKRCARGVPIPCRNYLPRPGTGFRRF